MKKIVLILFALSEITVFAQQEPHMRSLMVPGQSFTMVARGETGVTYHVYVPQNYMSGELPPVLFAFSPGGRGMGILNKIKDGTENAGWLVVGCDSLRNNFKDRQLAIKMEDEILDDVLKNLPHNTQRIYLGGFSGGAWRAYNISARRSEKFAGILAYGGWLGGEDSQDDPYCEHMSVAIINGSNDKAANGWMPIDTESLEKRNCTVKHYAFEGGHKMAPPQVTEMAVEWLEEEWKRRTDENNSSSN